MSRGTSEAARLSPAGRLAHAVEATQSRRLRVAVLIHTSSVSGPGRQLAALISALESPDITFLVILVQRRDRPLTTYAAYLEQLGVRYTVVSDSGRFDPRLIARVAAVLKGFGPDVVETHGYKPTMIARALRLRRPAWNWIAFWHGATTEDLKVRLYHQMDRALMRASNHIVVMSEEQRRMFAKAGPPVTIVTNAVLPDLPSEPEPLELDGAERPILGVVGRLSSEKGVDVFLRAMAVLVARRFPFTAIVVGDGPDRRTLEAMSKELGVDSRVRFLGSRRDVRTVYQAIDLLVIPSRSEGLPNVLLEALAHDRAVVATSVGAIPAVVTSSLVGRLVPGENPDALADAIVQAIPLVSDARAAQARRAVAEKFSLASRAEQMRKLYSLTAAVQ